MFESRTKQTTIAISKRNHEFLLEFGRKGQSFDDVITEIRNRLEEKSTKVHNKTVAAQTHSGVGRSVEQSVVATTNTKTTREGDFDT
jgi:DNA-binding SARP family transcriptional activator